MEMPYPEMMQESIAKVEETRSRRLREEFPRLSLEERQRLLEAYHPDYRRETFRPLAVGPNKGDLVPNELADLLEARSRIDLMIPLPATTLMSWAEVGLSTSQNLSRLLSPTLPS